MPYKTWLQVYPYVLEESITDLSTGWSQVKWGWIFPPQGCKSQNLAGSFWMRLIPFHAIICWLLFRLGTQRLWNQGTHWQSMIFKWQCQGQTLGKQHNKAQGDLETAGSKSCAKWWESSAETGRRESPSLPQAACPSPCIPGPGLGFPQSILARSKLGPIHPTMGMGRVWWGIRLGQTLGKNWGMKTQCPQVLDNSWVQRCPCWGYWRLLGSCSLAAQAGSELIDGVGTCSSRKCTVK